MASENSPRYIPPPVDTAEGPDELRDSHGLQWKLVYANDFFCRNGVPITGWMTAGPDTVPVSYHHERFNPVLSSKAVYARPSHDTPFKFDAEWDHQGWGDELKANRLNPEHHIAYRYDTDRQHMVPCNLVPPDLEDEALEEYCKPLDLDVFQPGPIDPEWKHYTTEVNGADRTCTWQGCYYGDGFTESNPPALRKLSQHGDTTLNVLNGLATSYEHQPATVSELAYRHAKTVLWVLCAKRKKDPSNPSKERTYARLGIYDMEGLEDSGYRERGTMTGYDCSDWTQVPFFMALERNTADIAIMRAERLKTDWVPVPLNHYTPVQLLALVGPANKDALQFLGGHAGCTYPHCDMTGITSTAQKIRHHLANVGRLPAVATLMALRLNQASIALHRGCPIHRWPIAHNYVQPAAAQITRNGAASYLHLRVPRGDTDSDSDTEVTADDPTGEFKHVLDLFKPEVYPSTANAPPCRNILSAGRARYSTDRVEGTDGTHISDVYKAVWAQAQGDAPTMPLSGNRLPLHATVMDDPKALIDLDDGDQVENFFATEMTPIRFDRIDPTGPAPHNTAASIEHVTCTLEGFDTLDTAVQCYHPLAPRHTPEPSGYNGGLFCFVPAMVPPLPGITDVKARQPDWDPMKDDEHDQTRRRDKAHVHRMRRGFFSYAPVAKAQKERTGQPYDVVRGQSPARRLKWWWRAHQRDSRCEGFHGFREGPFSTGTAQSLTRTANTGISGAVVLLPNFPSLPYTHKLNLLAEAGPKLGPGNRPQNTAIKLAAWSLPGFSHFLEPVAIFAVNANDTDAVSTNRCLRQLPLYECTDPCLFKMCQNRQPAQVLFQAPFSAKLIAGTQFDSRGLAEDSGTDYVLDTLARFGSLKGLRSGIPARYAHMSNGQDAGLCFKVPTDGLWETLDVIGREAALIPAMPERELFGAMITGHVEQLWGSTMAGFMCAEANRAGYFYIIFRNTLRAFFPCANNEGVWSDTGQVPFARFVHAISIAITEHSYLKSLKLNTFGISTDDNHICDQPTCQGQLTLAARIAEIGFVTTGFFCNAMTPVHRRFWPGFTRPMQGQRYWIRRAQEMMLGFFTQQGLDDQLALLSVATSQPFTDGAGDARHTMWTKANALFASRPDIATLTRARRTVFRGALPDPSSLGPLLAFHPYEFYNCGDYHSVVSVFTDAREAKLLACDAYSKLRNVTIHDECFTTMESADTFNALKRQLDAAREGFISCLGDEQNAANVALCVVLRNNIDTWADADFTAGLLQNVMLPQRHSEKYNKMRDCQRNYNNISRFNTRRGNRMALDIIENRHFSTACSRIMSRITDVYFTALQSDSEDENQPVSANLPTEEEREQREAAALEQEYERNMPLQPPEAIAQAAQQIAEQEQRREEQPAAAAAGSTTTNDDFAFEAQLALDNIETTTQQLADSIRQSPADAQPSVQNTLTTVRDLDLDLEGLSATNAEKIITYYTTQERRKRDMEQAFEKYTETIEETKEVVKRAKTLVANGTGTRGDARLLTTLYNSLQCPVGLEVPLEGNIMRARINTGTAGNPLYGVGMATSTNMAETMQSAPSNRIICPATQCPMIRPQPFTRDRILTDIRDAFVPHVRAAMQATQPQVMAQVEDPNDELTWPVAMDRYLSNL